MKKQKKRKSGNSSSSAWNSGAWTAAVSCSPSASVCRRQQAFTVTPSCRCPAWNTRLMSTNDDSLEKHKCSAPSHNIHLWLLCDRRTLAVQDNVISSYGSSTSGAYSEKLFFFTLRKYFRHLIFFFSIYSQLIWWSLVPFPKKHSFLSLL